MIATLPMYDWPQIHAAHDALWAAVRDWLRAEGLSAPEHLDRQAGLWRTWLRPDLVLSQTCGLPFRTRLHRHVTLLGAPDLGLEGAPPGHYHSTFVVRRGTAAPVVNWQERVLAVNGFDSQSGWMAAQAHMAERGAAFHYFLHTGSHRESARAVADGRADIACIDSNTWRLLCRYMPEVATRLEPVETTRPTPGLPYITAQAGDAHVIGAALEHAIETLAPEHRAALHLRALVRLTPADYLAVETLPLPSQDSESTALAAM